MKGEGRNEIIDELYVFLVFLKLVLCLVFCYRVLKIYMSFIGIDM